MEYTKKMIREKLENDDKWLFRGVVAIYKLQTEEEKATDATKVDNGVGFNGVDAELLSSFAKQLLRKGYLNSNQKFYARKKMLKYAGQLAKIANKKIAI